MSPSTVCRIRRLADVLASPFRSSLARRARSYTSRKSQALGIERLEDRWVFAAPSISSSLPDALTLLNAAPLQVPLDGFDADGDVLTYQVSSSNPNVVAEFHEGNRSMRIHVVHAGDGTAADPAFEGDMVLELFEDDAPRTTAHIIQLIQDDNFYNGIIFHRIVEDFVIQGGDPTGTGGGGSPLPNFDDEFNPDLQHTTRGILSMAKSDDDTNDSQFFITLVRCASLTSNIPCSEDWLKGTTSWKRSAT